MSPCGHAIYLDIVRLILDLYCKLIQLQNVYLEVYFNIIEDTTHTHAYTHIHACTQVHTHTPQTQTHMRANTCTHRIISRSS